MWDFGGDDPAVPLGPSLWQRLVAALAHLLRPAGGDAAPTVHSTEHPATDLAPRPSSGRGRALRAAHRVLRQQFRSHRALCSTLPQLLYIERALARQGTAALQELPVGLLRHGLLQLGQLPWDGPAETAQAALHTLRLRLLETLDQRSRRLLSAGFDALDPDSFHGALDERQQSDFGPLSPPPAGVVVDDLPDSEYDAWPLQHAETPRRGVLSNRSGR